VVSPGRALVFAWFLVGCGRIGFGEVPLAPADAGGGFDGSIRAELCGDGRTQGVEICDDGNRAGGDGCSADCRAREICGDGIAQGEEKCDDANAIAGDGCEADCTFSCDIAADCADGNVCDGEELCTDHACVEGIPAPNGTACEADGSYCRGGSCALASCGDAAIDPGEECDDGDLENGDGCDNDCMLSCSGDCDDPDVCNGDEMCVDNVCEPGMPAPTGTECDRDGDPLTRDICLGAGCVRSICGDGYLDGGEECDDGNLDNGDGCDNDCRWSCATDMDCSDGDVCNGSERCGGMTHRCESTAPATDGTPCPGGRCSAGRCVAGSDSGVSSADAGSSDAGGPCAPTAPLSCFKQCRADSDCVLVEGACCCGCASGGVSESVHVDQVEAWNARMRSMCPRPVDCGLCLDVYRCLMGTQCVMNQCRAVEGSAS
jgi:cysteine-rich repeat protein